MLCHVVDILTHRKPPAEAKVKACFRIDSDDFAVNFSSKVSCFRRCTAGAAPPIIEAMAAVPLSTLQPVTEDQIGKLLGLIPCQAVQL